jgi:hypothetical protein
MKNNMNTPPKRGVDATLWLTNIAMENGYL